MSNLSHLFGSTRSRVLAGVTVLVLAAVSFWLWRRSAQAGEFITQPVERGAVRSMVNATGTVQALLTVQVGSQVSGQVEALYADYNTVVRQGQLLAKLDARRYEAELTGARANLTSAQARVKTVEAEMNSQIAGRQGARANVVSARVARDNAATILARYEELRQQGILSQNDYDTAKANSDSSAARYDQAAAQAEQVEAQIISAQAQVEQARAQVEQAEASLEQAQVNLEYTNITSPVDGVVVSRNVDVGQTVAASLSAPTLFIIANDLGKMQVHASVDEADIGSISESANVRFTVDAYPNRSFNGTIGEIRLEPLSVQNVVTYTVIVNVDNERLELKPGMTANIAVTVAERLDALKLPNTALRYLPTGMTREDVTALLREPGMEPAAGDVSKKQPLPPGAASGTASEAGGIEMPRAARGLRRSGDGRPLPAPDSSEAQLAPGQMWNPSEKIQFPRTGSSAARPGIAWVPDARREPQARRVMLGITDGMFTEVVSGELQPGDEVIVGDTAAAAPAGAGQGQQGQGGGRMIFGGPR